MRNSQCIAADHTHEDQKEADELYVTAPNIRRPGLSRCQVAEGNQSTCLVQLSGMGVVLVNVSRKEQRIIGVLMKIALYDCESAGTSSVLFSRGQ
jgi:hypothetical protein